jgi:hypothetical protein
MEKALIVAYRMNSRECNFLKLYPDKKDELLALHAIYIMECSRAKTKFDRAFRDLYKRNMDSEAQ